LHNSAIALSFQQAADFIARRIDEMRCKKQNEDKITQMISILSKYCFG
jgi:hypothetical protein